MERVLLAAPDKFRGTASAREAADAIAAAAADAGWRVRTRPLSDGGEGLVDALGGANRRTVVTGPLGRPVTAGWRLEGGVATIESAAASGLLLAGGASGNDPLLATSRGTGELIAAALAAGATEVLVGLGGSACSDGGRGALSALPHGLGSARVTVCADVETRFLAAAEVFGPQKGATPEQVRVLTAGLEQTRLGLRARFGRDPQDLPGSGAAGGLGGALASAGATIVSGFDHVAERVGLAAAVSDADLVVTGEGRLDATSFEGKVVGGVVRLARRAGREVAVVVGDRDDTLDAPVPVWSLVAEHGREAALADTLACLRATAGRMLTSAGGTA